MFRIIYLKLIKFRKRKKKQKKHHTGNAAQELTDLEHLFSMTFLMYFFLNTRIYLFLERTTRFWNNLHQNAHSEKIGKSSNLTFFGSK